MSSGSRVLPLPPQISAYWRSIFRTATSMLLSTFSMSSLSAMRLSRVPTVSDGIWTR